MHYTYRITKHASHDDFMLRQVQPGNTDKDMPKNSRKMKEYHGIRILIEQSGTMAVWDNIQLLLILTTTLALMAVSSCITDTVALNCVPQSDEYYAIKYERPRTKKAMAKKRDVGTDEQDTAEADVPDDGNIERYTSYTC